MKRIIIATTMALCACNEPIPGTCKSDSDCAAYRAACVDGFCISANRDAGPADGGDDAGLDAGSTCGEGYQSADGGCVDIDECSAGSRVCGPGVCKNTEGGYQCQCPDGYTGKACESCADGYERDAEAGTCLRIEYKCSSAECGASIQKRKCQGALCTDWAVASQCAAGAICSSDGKSATCTDCGTYGCSAGKCNACSSGACCKAGIVAAATVECKAWDEFRCFGTGCGARAEKKHLSQHCDGRSFDCTGAITDSGWGVVAQCTADQLCQSTGTSAAACTTCALGCAGGECKLCNSGVCCDAVVGKFRPSSFACGYPQSFGCNGTTCGAGAQTTTSTKYCTGASAGCDGPVVGGAPVTTQCGDQQLCVTDSASFARCETCAHGCGGGACWPQCNPADPCCTSSGTTYDCWYDSATKLEWENPGTAITEYQKLDGAVSHCSTRGPGWRVPTIDELRSLVRGCAPKQTGGTCGVTVQHSSYNDWSPSCTTGSCTAPGPGANGQFLPPELSEVDYKPALAYYSLYWSNTTVSDIAGSYWFVGFSTPRLDYNGGGSDMHKMRVRCVRSR